MSTSCSVISQSYGYKTMYAYSTASNAYAGYATQGRYAYFLKFKTPAFSGLSTLLEFKLLMNIGVGSTAELRYAICTSDANAGSYMQTTSVVSDPNQVVAGTTTFSGMTSDVVEKTFSISTTGLKSDTTYYLVLWCYNDTGVSIKAVDGVWGKHSASLTYVIKYTLSVTAGTGSTITVERVTSPSGSTGILTNGDTLYAGDELTVTFSVSIGYNLGAHTVNGSSFTSGGNHKVSTNVTVISTANLKEFSLTINKVSNGSITVNRTSSIKGKTGVISTGTTIYYFDKLKITFTPNSGYSFTETLVNSKSFSSGSTHEVKANVTVSGTTIALASAVGATNAEIGSVSTITIVRNNSSYRHTLSYSFKGLSGVIVEKTSSASYPWTVPTSFYGEIPSSQSADCLIICETFSGDTSLGVKSCTIKVLTSSTFCAPDVKGSVKDSNATTIALTGDDSSLIRYMSTAVCTISATAKNSSSIISRSINGHSVTADSPSKTFSKVEDSEFTFSATDSRGYTAVHTETPKVIKYVKLTMNPSVYRPLPTTGEVALEFNGNYYNGSFGECNNTLDIRYRYRTTSESAYGAWITIESSKYSTGSSKYNTPSAISLGTGFDYRQAYVFQIQARDGANGTVLSTATSTATVQQGIPVFDWGENDFNFNVDVKINEVNIIDIFYPVNSVFMSVNNSMPSPLSSSGTWSSITTGISGVYGWKRTA